MDPKHVEGPGSLPATRFPLSMREQEVVKLLCQPEPFASTAEIRGILDRFIHDGLAKVHPDGSVELTVKGADIYLESREFNEVPR